MSEWIEWPEGWLSEGNRSMNSYIEGSDRYAVEAGEFTGEMRDYAIVNPQSLIDHGVKYYVLVYNIFDVDDVKFYFHSNADQAQKMFEILRDPLGTHRKDSI